MFYQNLMWLMVAASIRFPPLVKRSEMMVAVGYVVSMNFRASAGLVRVAGMSLSITGCCTLADILASGTSLVPRRCNFSGCDGDWLAGFLFPCW